MGQRTPLNSDGHCREPRVIVVDDDHAVRDSVVALLAAHDRNAVAFPSVREMEHTVDPRQCGCLLLDVRMPGEDGVTALPRIKETYPCLVVIMVTAHADVDAAVSALKAGAVDFLKKPWRRSVLFEVIDLAMDKSVRLRRDLEAHDEARELIEELTPRESEVFDELITGAANKVIARRLDLSPRTVEFHRARIFEKMGVTSVAQLVQLKVVAESRLETR